ncbi:RNA polymerase sigma-70 factor [Fulvivirgaceae bacterium BMA10]|uniref:RNA polymerase sigma-70 factor n=1 Tax=Splendidivirga corallicola TaxID=3051826 RepID=A0ABT8KU99_9BACT|nr:RNA polymerase sigma-70 factor [Fulvivirgaceae bacterium BMA10]
MLIHENHSDKALLQKVMKGCERSFEVLFKKYHGFLYHYAFRVLRDESMADEMVHKTFIRIWDLKETLSDIKSFKNYIYSVNRSLVVDELRAISRNRRLAEQLAQRIISSHNSVEEDIIYNDLEEIALQAIEQLPTKRKEIFKLSRHDGFTHKEIAHKLNISENTVKVSVSKSLKQIRDYMLLNTDISLVLILSSTLL